MPELLLPITSESPFGILSPLRSTFTLNLSKQIQIPQDAKNPKIYCASCTLWNIIPNISGPNLNFWFNYDLIEYHAITGLVSGLYQTANINTLLSQFLALASLPSDLIQLQEWGPTQGTYISVNVPSGHTLNLSFNMMTVLANFGWSNYINSGLIATYTGPANATLYSPEAASLNPVDLIGLTCDLTASGYTPSGNQGSGPGAGLIAMFPITANPGEQIIYTSQFPIKFDLMKRLIDNVTISITDEFGNPVDYTATKDFFQALIIISYDETS